MPGKSRRIYWDANVFLHYIEGTAAYFTTLQGLLRQASTDNDLEIVTSTLSIAEVAYSAAEKQKGTLDPLIERAIQALWDDRSAVILVDVSILVVSEARDLIRRSISSGWTGLKPPDAIHLATVKRLKVNEFHTYEASRLDKYGPYLGCDVKEPSTDQLTLPYMDPMDLG